MRMALAAVALLSTLVVGVPLDSSGARASEPAAGASWVEHVDLRSGAQASAMAVGGSPAEGAQAVDVSPFSMLGISWDGAEGDALYRVRTDGSWTDWTELHVSTEHGPDRGTDEGATARARSEPAWVDHADGYEVRFPAGTANPRVHLVRETVSQVRAATAAQEPGNGADEDPDPADPSDPADDGPPDGALSPRAPAVHRRAAWSARPGTEEPAYADDLRMGFVHHTVNSNSYSAAEVPAMLRAIQAYHMDANGWQDIGYNLLIDRFGRVWEGREGGLNRPVIGAHTGGLNTGSFGVALIGDFTNASPSSAAVAALVDVLGWRLGANGIDPMGTATMLSRGNNDKFPEGTVVQLPVISGHRDGKNTSCPGARLYAQLPDIRRRVVPIALAAASPFGSLDKADRGPGGVRVQGWTADHQADTPLQVHVQVDGASVIAATADVQRSDVAAVFPGHGTAVGYNVVVPVPAGRHTICPIAINVGYGNNANLGCRTVDVATTPYGSLDVVRAQGGGVFVAGWAIDPDVASPVDVHVYVDQTATPLRAAQIRGDVAAAFPGYGPAHGFGAVLAAGPGPHQVCAYAINVGGGPNTTLGCRQITL